MVILIGDQRVKEIKVVESGDRLIDMLVVFPELRFDGERHQVQKLSKSISHGRQLVGEKLMQADSLLPNGIKLLIKECYRPRWVQKISWDEYTQFLKSKFPSWSDAEIYAECCKLNAPLDVAPHTTGGAVDLTLIHADGQWLDMGTEFNASPLLTANATYTAAGNISDQARKNRQMLAQAMTAAGFVNYPTEWWHWSYGDKYWALIKQKPHAIFDSLEIDF